MPFFRHVQRAVSSFRNRMTAASVGGSLSDVCGSLTRMAQILDFTTIPRAHKGHCNNVRTGKHISLTECLVISADVDSGEDKIFIRFSNLWSLLSIAGQINSGWDFLAPPSTFAEQMPNLGAQLIGDHYHNLCWTIMVVSCKQISSFSFGRDALGENCGIFEGAGSM